MFNRNRTNFDINAFNRSINDSNINCYASTSRYNPSFVNYAEQNPWYANNNIPVHDNAAQHSWYNNRVHPMRDNMRNSYSSYDFHSNFC